MVLSIACDAMCLSCALLVQRPLHQPTDLQQPLPFRQRSTAVSHVKSFIMLLLYNSDYCSSMRELCSSRSSKLLSSAQDTAHIAGCYKQQAYAFTMPYHNCQRQLTCGLSAGQTIMLSKLLAAAVAVVVSQPMVLPPQAGSNAQHTAFSQAGEYTAD